MAQMCLASAEFTGTSQRAQVTGSQFTFISPRLEVIQTALYLLLLLLLLQTFSSSGPRPQEISFQEFQNQILARGLVGRLEVVNGDMVRSALHASMPLWEGEGVSSGGGGLSGVEGGDQIKSTKSCCHAVCSSA
jgi:hypothetical protein